MEKNDTIKLLQECDAGSKMAVSSIDEVLDKVEDEEFKSLLEESKEHHTKLGNEIHELLLEHDSDDKEPNPLAKGMSWIKTNVKLELDNNDATIADLIVDGCNMGIKSLRRYLNEYKKADKKSRNICEDLIDIEEELREDIEEYL